VLVVDQFEELFTPECSDTDRVAVIRNLIHAARSDDDRPPPAIVVLGMRADFYAQAAAVPDLHPVLQDHAYVLPAMTRDELRAAITGPARTVGLHIDGDLLGTLLTETATHDQAGSALPLLAHALKATFEHRDGNRLTLTGYHAVGGIGGAIAHTADTLYDTLTPTEQDQARRVFQSLVTLGEGLPDTRRRVPHRELLDTDAGTRACREKILDLYINARLITADDTTYLLAHETLITAWPHLAEWLNQDRDGRRLHEQLRARAHTWHHNDRDPDAVLRGTDLENIREWADRHTGDLDLVEQD
jgi:hypothetical protein